MRPSIAASSTRLKLVRCNAALRHEPGAVDRARMTGEDVVAFLGAPVHLPERRELGDGVGVVRRVVQHRRVLTEPGDGEVEEGAGAERDDPAHVVCATGVEHVRGAREVHRVEVVEVLTGPTEQGRGVDRRLAALGRGGTSSASVMSPCTSSTPMSASAAASSGLRTSALTASPRSISCSQTLAPVRPVPPVTKTVLKNVLPPWPPRMAAGFRAPKG